MSLMVFTDGSVYLKPDGFYRAQNVLDNHGRRDAARDDAVAMARPASLDGPARYGGAFVPNEKMRLQQASADRFRA